jgi:hypothetical protein
MHIWHNDAHIQSVQIPGVFNYASRSLLNNPQSTHNHLRKQDWSFGVNPLITAPTSDDRIEEYPDENY